MIETCLRLRKIIFMKKKWQKLIIKLKFSCLFFSLRIRLHIHRQFWHKNRFLSEFLDLVKSMWLRKSFEIDPKSAIFPNYPPKKLKIDRKTSVWSIISTPLWTVAQTQTIGAKVYVLMIERKFRTRKVLLVKNFLTRKLRIWWSFSSRKFLVQ